MSYYMICNMLTFMCCQAGHLPPFNGDHANIHGSTVPLPWFKSLKTMLPTFTTCTSTNTKQNISLVIKFKCCVT